MAKKKAVIEEAAPEEEAVEEEAVEEEAPEEEAAEEEPVVVEEAAPDEPDQPAAPSKVPDGVITAASDPEAHKKLMEIWKVRGSPRNFDYQKVRWVAINDGDGTRFVGTGGSGGSMDAFYSSLSVG